MASVSFKQNEEKDDEIEFFSKLTRPSDHFKYLPPPRSGPFASRFLRDPVTATLSQLSKVANYANLLSPSESNDEFNITTTTTQTRQRSPSYEIIKCSPPPSAKPIISSASYSRLPLLKEIPKNQTREAILNRIYSGGIDGNELRQILWPFILELTDNIDETFDWEPLEKRYQVFHQQWQSIDEDQEHRFTAYRERKSIAERDVVRSDRSRPFFSESTGNIEKLRDLLLCYIMYDFDTGYVQGMSDLASPILFVFDGDTCKAFWCFVQMMKLFKRNFEMSQNSISHQLKMLMKLIKLTDPHFAEFLVKKDSDNCYFAFRWIICVFKREFMKHNDDGYDECLKLWETVWSLAALSKLTTYKEMLSDGDKLSSLESDYSTKKQTKLADVELYLLCISLSIIRKERDHILTANYDAAEILKHFNTLSLKENLNEVLVQAATIYHWLKYDGQEENLYKEEKDDDKETNSIDDFEILNGDIFFSPLAV